MSSARPTGVAEAVRPAPRGGTGLSRATRRHRPSGSGPLAYALIAPVLAFIIALALVPAAITIVQSFFTVNALDPPTRFSGLTNFRRLAQDVKGFQNLPGAFTFYSGLTLEDAYFA